LQQVLEADECARREGECPSAGPGGQPVWERQHLYPILDSLGHLLGVLRLAFGLTPERQPTKRRLKVMEPHNNPPERRRLQKQLPGADELSRREQQVLALMAEGLSNPGIASWLGISPHTVKSHVVHIFNKLGVNRRTRAVAIASRLELL
jgi:ATP/maltotriose-dependent transcriptional regulator MalT